MGGKYGKKLQKQVIFDKTTCFCCLVLTKKMQGESLVLQRFLNFKLYIPVSLKSPLAHSKQTYTESLPLQQFMKNLCRFTGI